MNPFFTVTTSTRAWANSTVGSVAPRVVAHCYIMAGRPLVVHLQALGTMMAHTRIASLSNLGLSLREVFSEPCP